DETGEDWYWAAIPIQQQIIYMGFPRSHINAQPPLVLILLLIVGSLATLATAAVLVRHLVTPLELLAQGAQQIGSGKRAALVPESGPDELVTLAHSFNEMAVQVQELLTNRTTLLAGISHDLRTPLARIQLALEMLPANSDSTLVNGMKGDVDQMNCLIGQFLELSRVLERGEKQEIEIRTMLDDIVSCARRGGAQIIWQPGAPCSIISNPLALRRIVVNLLENAVRYGGKEPVEVCYTCEHDDLLIKILDRGPGIPEEQLEAVFRPFYRLEQSRNTETGGTGLGLSIAQQLADINNLSIKLVSRAGGGTEAIIKKSSLNNAA
ncbi:MAG TPA: ATP-binding protein, partial [Gammaproteobacteria bacterium]